jgi:hypothetical protein
VFYVYDLRPELIFDPKSTCSLSQIKPEIAQRISSRFDCFDIVMPLHFANEKGKLVGRPPARIGSYCRICAASCCGYVALDCHGVSNES